MIDKFRAVLASKLPPGSFIRNVVTLMTGTVFAQILLILVAPILTRLYSPSDFGVFNLFTSIGSILAVVACLRYEGAIVLPEKDKDAANVFTLCITICISMAIFILVIVAFFRESIADLFNAPSLSFWLWFMPLSIIVSGLFMVFNYWSTRRKQFKRLAVRQVTNSTVTALTQISVGATFHIGPGGLIGGSLIGQLVATVRLAWQIYKDEGKQIISFINKISMKHMLYRYKKFPLYDSWAALLNTSSNLLPALLLAYFFNPVVVGLYALGNRVLGVPMGVIGNAVSQVFFPRAVEARRAGELDYVALKMFNILLNMGFVPILLIAIVAPDLFRIVFGSEWILAGEYVRWLSAFMLLAFISSPISSIYSVMERQREGLIIYLFVFVIRLTALIIGGMKGDALFTVALFGISEATFRFFNCCYILHMAGVRVSDTIGSFTKQFLYTIPYALIPLLSWPLSHDSVVFVASGIGAGILFLIIKVYQIRNKDLSNTGY